jgi:hypothetical protein
MNRQRLVLILKLLIWILILSQLAAVVLMKTVGYGFTEAFHEVNGLFICVLLVIYVILDWRLIKKTLKKTFF